MSLREKLVRIKAFMKTCAPRWVRRRWVLRLDSPDVYDHLYATPRLLGDYLDPSRLALYQEVAGQCRALKARRILDVGCGPGGCLAAMTCVVGDGAVLCGLDRCMPGLLVARKLCPGALLARGDIYALPYKDKSFDLIICMETFEHLDDPRRALDALRKLCAPEGTLVITIPDGARDKWEGHLNFWQEREFRDFCGEERIVDCLRVDNGRNLMFRLRP